MITLTEEQFKEMIEAAHRAGQHNQGHCDPSAYEAMVYYECEVKKLIIPDVSVELPVYNIDFGGNVMAGIVIESVKLKVIGAINGGGFPIDSDKIIVTKGN